MLRPVALFLTVHCTFYGLSTRSAVLFYTLSAVSAGAHTKTSGRLEGTTADRRETILFDPPDRLIPLFLVIRSDGRACQALVLCTFVQVPAVLLDTV
jgi:hypothetical protein